MIKRRVSRRSFFALVSGSAAIAVSSSRSAAQSYTGVTDADTGAGYDYPGYGRGTARTQNQACSGVTDADTGANYDPVGCGRQAQSRTCSGVTDSDTGASYDPIGCGTGGRPQQPVGPSNSAECQALQVQMDTLAERFAGYVVRFSAATQQFNYQYELMRRSFGNGNQAAYAQALNGFRAVSAELRTTVNGMTATEAGLLGLAETMEVYC